MTRLDENRARAQLAQKAGVDITAVTNVTIWGNHSADPVSRFLQREDRRPNADQSDRRREVAEGNLHPDGATTRRRRHQGPRPFLRRLGRQRGRRHRPQPNDRHRARRLAQRRGLLRRQLRRREGFDQLLSRSARRAANGRSCPRLPINEFSRTKIDASVAELREEKSR